MNLAGAHYYPSMIPYNQSMNNSRCSIDAMNRCWGPISKSEYDKRMGEVNKVKTNQTKDAGSKTKVLGDILVISNSEPTDPRALGYEIGYKARKDIINAVTDPKNRQAYKNSLAVACETSPIPGIGSAYSGYNFAQKRVSILPNLEPDKLTREALDTVKWIRPANLTKNIFVDLPEDIEKVADWLGKVLK